MTELLRCSFCKKPQNDVRKLIAGPSVNICDECVTVCDDIIADDGRFTRPAGQVGPESMPPRPAPTPAGGLAIACSLCRMPVPPEDSLAIPQRGALCPGCVGEIAIAIARRGEQPSDS